MSYFFNNFSKIGVFQILSNNFRHEIFSTTSDVESGHIFCYHVIIWWHHILMMMRRLLLTRSKQKQNNHELDAFHHIMTKTNLEKIYLDIVKSGDIFI